MGREATLLIKVPGAAKTFRVVVQIEDDGAAFVRHAGQSPALGAFSVDLYDPLAGVGDLPRARIEVDR